MSIMNVQIFRMLQGVEPSLREVLVAILEEIERQQKERVTKDEFNELKGIVAELAEAQRDLAEAQKRAEARVEELAKAQKRTEARLDELAQAQVKTEKRLDSLSEKVEELAEAQRRTEAKVEELAEAQKRTEEELQKLAKGLRETRKMVGGLSDTVGYGLEDRAIAALPRLLEERFGIQVKDRLVRRYISLNGREQELNMFGEGIRNGQQVFIVGEGKARLSKKNVQDFERLLNRLVTAGVCSENIFPVLVTYTVRPEIEEYAASKGIHVIWSYDLQPAW